MPEAPKKPCDLAEKNRSALQFIEDVTSRPDDVQGLVLSEILSCNAGVEYLRRLGIEGHSNRDTSSLTSRAQFRADLGHQWGPMYNGRQVYDGGYGYGLPPAYDPGMYAAAGSAYTTYPAVYGGHQQQVS